MNSINTITLTGRCGGDPQIKYFDDGNAVANVSLAVNRTMRGEEEVFWVEVSIWGKRAQAAADYVKKGTLLGVTGRVEPVEAWVDKQGNAKAKLKVAANNWEILRQPGDGQPGNQAQVQQSRPAPQELPF